jgi:hypothetical protein
LKPSDEFDDTVILQNSFGQYEVNEPLVLVAEIPSLTSATDFQDRVATTVQNQGPRCESGGVIFDYEYVVHRPCELPAGLR